MSAATPGSAGAGDGGLADLVMEAHPESTCVLVDFSEPMFGAAHERLAGRQGRWELVNADLATAAWTCELPAGERFDAILSRLCIHHLPDTRKRELYEEDILLDPETQSTWLSEIGFEQVEIYFKAIELAIFAGVRPGEAQ